MAEHGWINKWAFHNDALAADTVGRLAMEDGYVTRAKISGAWPESAQVMYIDVNQTDSDETGTIGDAYQTIQAAVDAVIVLADNSDTKAYVFMIAPGTYAETIDLDSTALYNIAFIAMAGPHTVFINPTSGNALETDANNANLGYLYVKDITFNDPISLVGAADNTLFLNGDCVFENCTITLQSGTSLTVTNANRFEWKNGKIHVLDTIAIQNVALFVLGPNFRDIFALVGAPGNTTIVSNPSANTPYNMKDANDGDDMVVYRVLESYLQRKEPTFTTTNSGKIRVEVRWSYFGIGLGSMSFTTDEHLYAYNSTFLGNITCGSGSVLRWNNSMCRGTFTTTNCTDKRFYTDDPDIMESKYILNVDMNAVTPTQGANGSIRHPYKTIMAAVNVVITNADNSDAIAYVIKIAPGTYTETVTLENAALKNLSFIATGENPASGGYSNVNASVILDPTSDPALESEASNTNLHYLHFKGIRFVGSIHLKGDIQNTYFGEDALTFEDCGFEGFRNGTVHINLENLERFTWVNGCIGRGTVLTAQNIWSMSINGERFSDWPMDMAGGWTLTATTAQNMPYHMDDENAGGDQMTFSINGAFLQMNNWTMAQGGTGVLRIQCRNGFMNGSFTMPTLGTVTGYTGIFNNNITMSGTGTISLYNTVIKGTLTENGCAKNVYASET